MSSSDAPLVPVKIEVMVHTSQRQMTCIGTGISVEGMRLCAPLQEKLGQYMRLMFRLQDQGEWVAVDALLLSQTHQRDHVEWGLSFVGVSAKLQRVLEAFIAGLTKPPAPTRGAGPRYCRVHGRDVTTERPSDEHENVGYRTGSTPAVKVRPAPTTTTAPTRPASAPARPTPARPTPARPQQRAGQDAGTPPRAALRTFVEGFGADVTPIEEIYRRALEELDRNGER